MNPTKGEDMTTRMLGLDDLPALFKLATALLKAGNFLPAHFRTEGQIVAVILAGSELGIPAMASLRSLTIIMGKVVINADQQLALMARAGASYRWLHDGTDGFQAVLEVTRPNMRPYVSRYTWEMAEHAGLTKNEVWCKHPASMLRARAVSGAGKAYMPDVLSGCYVPGELDDAVYPAALSDKHLTAGHTLSEVIVASVPTPSLTMGEIVEAVYGSPQKPDSTPPPAPENDTLGGLDFRSKLVALKTEPELVTWAMMVLEHDFSKEELTALRGMLRKHCKNMKLDDNRVMLKAKNAKKVEV